MTTPPAWLRRVVDVRGGEIGALFLACAYFFCTLASFFVLRPIRDEFAVAAGVRQLPYLFLGTLTATLVGSALYSALAARVSPRRLVGVTLQVFAATLVGFWIAARLGVDARRTGLAFFVWLSVYNVFVVSIFWSVMADAFRSAQAARLFGFIGVGGTLGSIAGSAATALLVRGLGSVNLLLVSLVLLEASALLAVLFARAAARSRAAAQIVPSAETTAEAPARAAAHGRVDEGDARVLGGSARAAVTHVVRSPYLRAIALFLVLYTFGSTVLYFAQTEILGAAIRDRDARTELLARMEFATQSLTALTQALFTGRLIRLLGLPTAMALMPALGVVGFAALGSATTGVLPLITTFVVLSVVRRATNFAITNPATEVLFTVVPREDKYKAKGFIETFVYRASDQLAAWTLAGLTALGLGVGGISWIAMVLSAVMLAVGVWLGRRQRSLAAQSDGGTRSDPSHPAHPAAA